jgi:PAS domain S-box-containing protein
MMVSEPTYEDLKKRVRELESLNNKLRAEGIKYQSLFEHAGVAIALIDTETNQQVEFNGKAYESLGYTKEEFEGLTIYDIDPFITEEERKRRHEIMKKEGVGIFENTQITKDKELRNILSSIVAMRIGTKEYVQDIRFDITEYSKVEKAL